MKNIIILGGGESGVGAAILAKKNGYKVFVSDKGIIREQYKLELIENKIEFEETKHTSERLMHATEVIKSPGIPDKVAIVQSFIEKGIPVISDIEFASRYTNAKIIAITGSNGKTTSTNLIYHILKTAGYNVGIGGNVGYSFARLVAFNDFDFFVLELSSFQLDGILEFKPNVAILLNITPDHLDRYDYNFDNYVQSKFRIIKNLGSEDLFIYNGDDKSIINFLKDTKVQAETITVTEGFYKNGHLVLNDQIRFDMENCALKGDHNRFNAICAIHASTSLGVKENFIQTALDTFNNDPHRLENLGVLNGVEFINDSKATNVDAVFYALKAMEKPIVWIAGGIDKGNDYGQLLELVESKVVAIVCLGLDNKRIIEYFSPFVKIIEETRTAKEAVKLAYSYAEKGSVVLLSPACSSFDLFENYKKRGEEFTIEVNNLIINNQCH